MTEAPYQRIAADLRELIASGTTVPSVSELGRRYGCTRPTVRRAMDMLKGEGLLGADRRPVNREPITLRASAHETLTLIEDIARGGHVLDPPEIRVKIEGDTLIREVRRRVDRQWHNWAQWRFPVAVAMGTRLQYEADIEQGSIRYLAEGLGWTVIQETPYYDFRAPTPREAVLLNPQGWVVAEHRAGVMTNPERETQRFGALRILVAARTRLVP